MLEHLVGAPDAATGPVALDQRLAEVAARGDLRVTLALEPLTVPVPVAEAFADAAAEALINTHRHAGVDHAALRLFTCDGAVQTEVRDAGCGFDRTRVPPYRYGVREGILSRMRSVGGDAAIDSGPGGTTVTLRWRP